MCGACMQITLAYMQSWRNKITTNDDIVILYKMAIYGMDIMQYCDIQNYTYQE